MQLPRVRSHEIIDYKRCQTKWYWNWRKGLTPKYRKFGALDLGDWVHQALEHYYIPGWKRGRHPAETLYDAFTRSVQTARAAGAPQEYLEQGEQFSMLGEAMMNAYVKRYGNEKLYVYRAELPLGVDITNHRDIPIARYKLKLDGLVRDRNGLIWILEHKTAATISTGHLPIDDQARPYAALSEIELRRKGILKRGERVYGILYNYMRKALPDERETDSQGRALNKNGQLSKRQPSPNFERYPLKFSDRAKLQTLRRKRREVVEIVTITDLLRRKEISWRSLNKTPAKSCEKTCPFFTMCVVDEEGSPIEDMQRAMYDIRDPYEYDQDTTEEKNSFEMR